MIGPDPYEEALMIGATKGHILTLHAHDGSRFHETTFKHSTDASGRRQMTSSIRVGSVECCGGRVESRVVMHWKADEIAGGTRGGVSVDGWDSTRMAIISFAFELEECGKIKKSDISVDFPNNYADFK